MCRIRRANPLEGSTSTYPASVQSPASHLEVTPRTAHPIQDSSSGGSRASTPRYTLRRMESRRKPNYRHQENKTFKSSSLWGLVRFGCESSNSPVRAGSKRLCIAQCVRRCTKQDILTKECLHLFCYGVAANTAAFLPSVEVVSFPEHRGRCSELTDIVQLRAAKHRLRRQPYPTTLPLA